MAKHIRCQILLTQGTQTVKELEAVLPPPWQNHPRTKKDAKATVTCVAPLGHGKSEERLRRILFKALGKADFEWEEVREEAATRKAERSAQEKIKAGLRKGNAKKKK